MISTGSSSSEQMALVHRLPVVVILGATATGKSKLAVHLAKKFSGEVISADSMQVYKGLDILTNKVTDEEMQSVPHHMISIVKPCETFDVTCFRNRALPVVTEILSKGKIPFIVGGTNYYIESLLWKVLIQSPGTESKMDDVTPGKRKTPEIESTLDSALWDNEILSYFSSKKGEFRDDELGQWTSTELHSALREVDEERANRLHPNDIRKVIRSLQVRFRTGRKHSELIAEQNRSSLQSRETELPEESPLSPTSHMHLGGPLRFPNSLCLWIRTPKEILDQRIDTRVEEMVSRGLREELNSYFEELLATNRDLDFTRGLLQSIGFKEFRTYLQEVSESKETEDSEDKVKSEKLFAQGISELKLVTKRYARRQLKWINQRFLRPSRRQVPPVYWLDCSTLDATDWDEEIVGPSEKILEAHLDSNTKDSGGDDPSFLSGRRIVVTEARDDDFILRTCETCEGRQFMGKVQWEIHLKSRKHHVMEKRTKAADCLASVLDQSEEGKEELSMSNPEIAETESSLVTKC